MMSLDALRYVLDTTTINLNEYTCVTDDILEGAAPNIFFQFPTDEEEDDGTIRYNNLDSTHKIFVCNTLNSHLIPLQNMEYGLLRFTIYVYEYLRGHCTGNLFLSSTLPEAQKAAFLDEWAKETWPVGPNGPNTVWANAYVYPDSFANLKDNMAKSNNSHHYEGLRMIEQSYMQTTESFYAIRRAIIADLAGYPTMSTAPVGMILPSDIADVGGVTGPSTIDDLVQLITPSFDEMLKFAWSMLHATGAIRIYPNITPFFATSRFKMGMLRELYDGMVQKVPQFSEEKQASMRYVAQVFAFCDMWARWADKQMKSLNHNMIRAVQDEARTLREQLTFVPAPKVIEYSDSYSW